jgi:hypothetical protein
MVEVAADLFSHAERLRDEAIKRVSRDDWMSVAMAAFRNHASKLPAEFTGEDIRNLVAPIAGPPHHHNAWGAFTMTLVRKHLIEATGGVAKMKATTSHARRTFLYRMI